MEGMESEEQSVDGDEEISENEVIDSDEEINSKQRKNPKGAQKKPKSTPKKPKAKAAPKKKSAKSGGDNGAQEKPKRPFAAKDSFLRKKWIEFKDSKLPGLKATMSYKEAMKVLGDQCFAQHLLLLSQVFHPLTLP